MIVVTTPTGQIGRRVVRRLLDAGSPVRVIARDPATVPGLEVVAGSHADPEVLETALDGADSLFLLVPPDRNTDDVVEHYRRFARAAAATAHRIVAVSSLGRGYPGPAGTFDAAFAMDEVIEASGADYRALRPPFFMENLRPLIPAIREHGVLAQPLAADRVLPLCAVDDIADAAAGLLLDRAWSGVDSVPLMSPDDLTPAGMAGVLSDVLGRTVRFERLPIAGYRSMLAGFGMSEAAVTSLAEMAEAQDGGAYGCGPQPSSRTVTDFRSWCECNAK